MASQHASAIERLFSPCSAIHFLVSPNDRKVLPAIVFGFDDEVSGSVAYSGLRQWANDDELILALCNRKEYIDATLIHTGSYETATIRQLAFSGAHYANFISSQPQDRKLQINHFINPIKGNARILKGIDPSPLTLVRYILVTPGPN